LRTRSRLKPLAEVKLVAADRRLVADAAGVGPMLDDLARADVAVADATLDRLDQQLRVGPRPRTTA
jgi:hypothetical protein